jgi:hypothetical protein
MGTRRKLYAIIKTSISRLSPVSLTGTVRWPQALLIYVVSHGFLLASWNALYWDDWMVYANGSKGVEDFFASCDRCTVPFRPMIESFLIAPGPWLMRVLTFLFFPLISFVFFQFLRRTDWLNNQEIGALTLLLLLLPMYGARIAHIDFHYSLSLLLFVLGAWMTLSPQATVRISAIVPIFWSMFTASLQVFVVVLIAVLCAKLARPSDHLHHDRMTIVVVAFLSLAPIIHRFLLPRVLPDLQVTDGYNSIQPAFLVRAVLFSALLMCPLLHLLNLRRLRRTVSRESYQLGIGLAVLAAGTFPYLAVGHFSNFSDWILPLLPDQSDWNSRHQLLQPFGLALILVAIARKFESGIRSLITLVLITSVVVNIATYSGYYLDQVKQNEFIAAVAGAETQLEGVSALVISDQARRFNARGRDLRAYEWAGMIYRATGQRFIVDGDSIQYCQESKPTRMLTITASNGRLRSLVTGTIGISVDVAKLTLCDTSRMSTP